MPPPSSPSTASSSRVSSSVLLSSVWQLLIHVFIPASLANEALRQQPLPLPLTLQQPSTDPPLPLAPASPPESLAAKHAILTPTPAPEGTGTDTLLQSCDLVLVVTPGVVYREFRRLASHSYDHLAIALSADSVLHVGPPNIRLLPASLLLQPIRHPLVLRPHLTEQQRTALVQSLTPLIGQPYDTMRVLALIARLATAQTADKRRQRRHNMWSGQRQSQHSRASSPTTVTGTAVLPPPSSFSLPSSSLSSLICTDAILNRLLAVSPQFRAIVEQWQRDSETTALLPLDFHTMHSWSINDIHRIAHATQPLVPAVNDQRTPFFISVQLPCRPARTPERVPRVTRANLSLRSSQLAGPMISSAASATILWLLRGWFVKPCSSRRANVCLSRLLALLSFAVLFYSFLPPIFRTMTVFLAVLVAMRQYVAARLERRFASLDLSKFRLSALSRGLLNRSRL